MRIVRLLALCLAVSFGFMIPASIYGTAQAPSASADGHFLVIAQAMAQASHQLLIDRHKAANVSCASCHGTGALSPSVAMATCLNCHGTYSQLADRTRMEPNPHRSHMGEVACSSCHNVHKVSVSFCDQCHSFGMTVP